MKLLVLVLGAACGCAGAEAMTTRDAPAVAAVAPKGELGLNPRGSMSFEVHLAGGLAGEAQLAVGQIGAFEGHRAIVVRSRAATAGAAALFKKISDEATTTIDVDSGRPLVLETVVTQGGKTLTASARFTGSVATVTYQRSDEAKTKAATLN